MPVRIRLIGTWQEVVPIRRPWRIDQHWWREQPVQRHYYQVAPADGAPLTVFRDLRDGCWYRQEY